MVLVLVAECHWHWGFHGASRKGRHVARLAWWRLGARAVGIAPRGKSRRVVATPARAGRPLRLATPAVPP